MELVDGGACRGVDVLSVDGSYEWRCSSAGAYDLDLDSLRGLSVSHSS